MTLLPATAQIGRPTARAAYGARAARGIHVARQSVEMHHGLQLLKSEELAALLPTQVPHTSLPIGVHLMADHWQEHVLLQAAAALEAGLAGRLRKRPEAFVDVDLATPAGQGQ